MKLSFLSPLPPAPTGIADYTRTLVDALAARKPDWTLETFDESGAASASPPLSEVLGRTLPVYHMGNSPYHDFVYPYLFRYPGVVVLHDLVLHHARLAYYMKSPEVEAYRRDMGDTSKRDRAIERLKGYEAEVGVAYPREGASIAEIAIRMGGGRLLYDYPLNELVARSAKMVLVHSRDSRDRVVRSCPGRLVRYVRMGVELPAPVAREEARRRLGLGPGLIIASLGWVTPEKRISHALSALKRLIANGIDVHYLLVGTTVPHFDPLSEARELGVADRVTLTGRVSEEDFRLYTFASDVCLNLRYPSAGETSAALLHLLAAGRAVLITDQVHHLDLPDETVARSSMDGNEDGLYCDLLDLLRDPRKRKRLEVSARRFVAAERSVRAMVNDYVQCLEEAANLPAPEIAGHALPARTTTHGSGETGDH